MPLLIPSLVCIFFITQLTPKFSCNFNFLPRSPPKAGFKTRAFCDICDVFDLHETEDCPLQSNEDDGGGSKNHGTRGQERPYCEICESKCSALHRLEFRFELSDNTSGCPLKHTKIWVPSIY